MEMNRRDFLKNAATASALAGLVLCFGLTTFLYGEQVAGYRRDGTGIYPGAGPPTDFSYPADLRWETLLPSRGHGSPIVVKGKVFVLVEPCAENCWPRLLAYDMKTGKEAWRATLSTAEAAYPNEPAKRAEAEKSWETFSGAVMDGYRTGFHGGGKKPTEKSPTAAKNKETRRASPATQEVRSQMSEVSKNPLSQLTSDLRPLTSLPDSPISLSRISCFYSQTCVIEALTGPLRRHGMSPETWHDGGCGYRGVNCVGQAYPTPCSDGEHVYVATAHGVFACFDLAGKRRWLARVPGNGGEYCRNGRSPILYKQLLISDITDKVRAFDSATGTLAWSDDLGKKKHSTIVSPMVLTVSGKDILWAAGCNAYLLPDGKKLNIEGWTDCGMQTLVKYDEPDVIFFCGSGEHCGWTGKGKGVDPMPPAAVRFSLSGNPSTHSAGSGTSSSSGQLTLKANVLWSGINGKYYGGNQPWMLYHGGKLYAPGAGAVDALTRN